MKIGLCLIAQGGRMSFQDFGKPGAGRRDGNNNARSLTPITEQNRGGWNKQGSGAGSAHNSYAQVSDGVLQYRVSPFTSLQE